MTLVDQPPVYCYANWDDVTRELVGPESYPPSDYCNVSCAYHMSDPVRTFHRVRKAISEGKGVSAHPGVDIAIHGRRITAEDVYSYTICQLGALKALVEAEGGRLSHVKPHGILFILLRDQASLMRAFLKAQIALLGNDVPFHGLAETTHEAVALEMGVPFVAEILKDKIDRFHVPPCQQPAERPRLRPGATIRQSVRSGIRRGQTRVNSQSAPRMTTSPVVAAVPSPLAKSAQTRAPVTPELFRPAQNVNSSPGQQTPPARPRRSPHDEVGAPFRSPYVSPPTTPKMETSAHRLLRVIHHYTMSSIPTMIESRRGSPANRDAGAARMSTGPSIPQPPTIPQARTASVR